MGEESDEDAVGTCRDSVDSVGAGLGRAAPVGAAPVGGDPVGPDPVDAAPAWADRVTANDSTEVAADRVPADDWTGSVAADEAPTGQAPVAIAYSAS